MAEETIQILRIETGEAVKSVNDLRENVKILKERLGELEIGTSDYQETLDELKVNQNAVKDAMYASTASMDDLAKSATGTSNSYNALVHRMAALKEELRATDVSTQQGKERFKELAGQINEVNNTLKDMDALQGNFQRNVGNYPGLMKTWAGSVDALDKGFKALDGNLGHVKNGLDALSASPAVATFAILVSAVVNLTSKLQENENVAASMKRALDAFKPILDFLKGIMETLGNYLADIITKVTEMVTSNGLMDKVVHGVMGVGNAIMQFVIAPFKGIVKAIEVLKDEGIKGLRNATKAFGDELKNGVSFKANYQAGQAVADAIISGAKSKKAEIKEAGKEIGKDLGDGIAEGLKLSDLEKALSENERRLDAYRQRIANEAKEIGSEIDAETQEINASIDAMFEEEKRLREQDLKDAEIKSKAKIQTYQSVATSMSSILGAMASIYESDERNATKNVSKIKALKVAEATINTINGAIGAYMQACATLPPPFGQITGAASAAAITAAGIAQVAQIKNTQISSTGAISSVPAAITAPTMQMDLQNVHTITSASEEDRLNRLAEDQRVILVMSDLEERQNDKRVQVEESSF